jgi:isoquinoline 1-oxidoreductase alpha subunit
MSATHFILNGQPVNVASPAETTLLLVLREELGLTGTKLGCEIAQCGVCTVHLDGRAVRACVTALAAVANRQVMTIEGLRGPLAERLHAAWIAEQTPQCGYCQPGQIMEAAALLAEQKQPTREQIVARMDGHLCRCGTYNRIVRAIQRASGQGAAP